MGYRSDGKIFIPKELEQELSDEMIISLDEDWEKEEVEDGTIYSFEHWKWYDGYEVVDMFNNFYYHNRNRGVDMIVIGEDNAVIIEPQFERFGYTMVIEVY